MATPELQREYQRQWISRRRAAWLTAHGPCVDCGTWDDLQVDHVDATRKVSHNVWSWRRERREAELAKCVVRCEPCHVIKTVINGDNGYPRRRLTVDEVRRIRAAAGTERAVAAEFGISPSHVHRLRSREQWRFI